MSEGVVFEFATPADNADILRLLSENPMGGAYWLSLERAPDAFAAPAPREDQVYVIARSAATGQAVGLCERLVRTAFVNGRVEKLPYLTALRVARSHRNRLAVLKGGFRTLRERAALPGELPFALTSVADDNHVARRVLTAGLKGLPTYRRTGGYATLILRPRRFKAEADISIAEETDLPLVAAFLQRELAQFQFAPVWTEDVLRSLPATFLLHRAHGEITGCVSLWDQRGTRQSVVRGYPRWVGATRPAINLAAPFLRLPNLPPVGAVIPSAYLSHLAVANDAPAVLLKLVRSALSLAAKRGHGAAVVGFAAEHPFREILRARLGGMEYRTSLYLVHWQDGAEAAEACDTRPAMPDVGLL